MLRSRTFLLFFVLICIASFLKTGTIVFASDELHNTSQTLNISTTSNRPISIDRLIHIALHDINYVSTVTTSASIQLSYDLANSGERDGTISSTPNMTTLYPNLIQVPVVLEQNNITAFTRAEDNFTITSWDELSGMKVAILTGRVYVEGQIPSTATITIKETPKQVIDGLVNNEYDVALFSLRQHETFLLPEGVANSGVLESLTEYLYMNKKHEHLVPAITEALNNAFADGRGEKALKNIPMPESSQKNTVLHIISSNAQITREEKFSESIRSIFEKDMSIEWYTVELNSRRFTSDESRLMYYANLIRQDSVARNISAIIVSGDDAMNFIKDYYNLLFKNTPVLFYGVSENYDTVEFDEYFAGIKEYLPIYETISAALEIFPETENLYFLNDYTTEGLIYQQAIKNQLELFSNTINIEYSENISSHLLFEHIKNLPPDTLVFVGSYFNDADAQYYSLKDVKRLLEHSCTLPVFSIHSTAVEYNSLGGKCLDYGIYGEIIGDMLLRLFNGENIGEMPNVTDSDIYSQWVFDNIKLRTYRISEELLPYGSIIINKPPKIWESDPKFAVTLLALLIVGIATTYLYLSYHKQKELLVKDDKINEVNKQLERIINTAPLAFMSSIDRKVVVTNEYTQKYLGLKPGDEASTLYTEPEQRDVLISQVSEKSLENQIVWLNTLSNGSHRFLSNYSTVEYDKQKGFILWAMDIEDSEKQKDKLHNAQKNLQAILDSLPIAVRITDYETGKIVYANNVCLKMFGYKESSDMCGLNLTDMFAPVQSADKNSIENIRQLIFEKKPLSTEIDFITADGKIIEALVTTCNIEYKGKLSTLGTILDLSAEKKRQEMLLSATQKEIEANQLKSRFLVNMSHEIRTPMNAIIGLTEIELHKNLSNGSKDIYKKINISAKNLLEIINDILDLSKIEADKMDLYEDKFELEEVLNSALLVASPRLDGKSVEFLLNASLDLPRYLIGDRTRLWQILKNFLDNSAKFTEKGKIVLSAYTDDSRSNAEIIYITFIIRDTGIGMSEEQMKKLFQPYEQIKNEAQKRYRGTGLGMAISKQLCEIMGGQLNVQSEPGAGTVIFINIPFKRVENNKNEIMATKSPHLAGLNVLAIDDDPLSLEIMSKLVEGSDAKCIVAKSGIDAIEIIIEKRNKGEFFDLILLDFLMEDLDGLETARQIHLSLSKAPKLLMVTSYQKALIEVELKENGIDGLIEKPFIPSQFIQKLCETMGINEQPLGETNSFTRFKDVNILMFEDYILNQEVASGMFEQFGIVADIANNGKEGIEILNKGKEYDLIFMDLQMPVMNGYEATEIIRGDSRFKNVPIISLTADAMKEIVDKCLALGMNDHIAKPIEFRSLQRVFLKWLPESKRITSETKETQKAEEAQEIHGIQKIQKIQNSQKVPKAPKMQETSLSNEGLARFGGNQQRYEKALLSFADLLPQEWSDFDEAIKDHEQTKQFVHMLKGVAGNLGENTIYKSAVEFESSIRQGKPERALYTKLIEASNSAKQRILKYKVKSDNLLQELGNQEEYNKLMASFKESLENFDPVLSSNVIAFLKKKTWPSSDKDKLEELCNLSKSYEYDAALDLLNSIWSES